MSRREKSDTMTSLMSHTVTKTYKKDPSPLRICLAIIMILVIATFMGLPFFLEPNQFDEYGPTIIVNTSPGKTHDEAFNKTKNDEMEEQGEKGEDGPTRTDHLSVQTEKGWIRGVETGGVRVFHGVPYAQPPIGQLRWAPPREMEPWSPQVYNATFKRNGCPQRCVWHQYCPQKTSEDCLFLEIYTPLDATPTSRLPVLVYLHGGNFGEMSATSPIYDSTYLVKRLGVVVVLVEYRLGALGFLVHTNEDKDILGNFGLLDQALALKWIQTNVRAFGGHPDQVTLAGQSAGSQSALIHLQSPETAQKFRSVILESAPLAFTLRTFKEGLEQARSFAQRVGCDKDESESETSVDLDCLRNLDTDAILDAQGKVKSFGSSYLSRAQPWGPVLDNKTLFTQLVDSFEREETTFRKPILCGVTGEEALFFVKSWFKKPTGLVVYWLALSILGKGADNHHRLKSLYPSKSGDSRDDVAAMVTDFLFRCPLKWAARKLHGNGIDTMWSYIWHKTLHFSKSFFTSSCSDRSCHGVEIPYIFHTFDTLNVTSDDTRMSDEIIDYYGNFIKNGDPNEGKESGSSDESLPDWPKAFSTSSGEYRALGFHRNGTVAPESGVSEDRCRFWIDRKFSLR